MGTKTAKHPNGDIIVFDSKWHSFKSIKQPKIKFISGTKLLKKFFPKFDKDGVSKRYAEKNDMSQADVIKMWNRKGEIGREMGTLVHNLVEDKLLGAHASVDELRHPDLEILEAARVKGKVALRGAEWVQDNYEVLGIEQIVACHEYGLATIIDLRVKNKKTGANGFLDWKTNASIRMSNNWQSGLGPIKHLEDCDYIKYALQLNMFEYVAIREGYITPDPDEEIEKQIIHIDVDDFTVLPVPDFQMEVEQMLIAHKGASEGNLFDQSA